MFYDYYYLVLVLPALLIATFAQIRVKSTFRQYSNQLSRRGYTGAQVARAILDSNGLSHIRVEHVAGNLTDHYDPSNNVIKLSDEVYGSNSIAAIGVAAHESGHALQDASDYKPMRIRTAIIPITNFGSTLSLPLILLGLILSFDLLAILGIVLFSTMTVFQLVTLPVEFNASRRALKTIEERGFLEGEELSGAKKVLSAAAMTYVAALFVSLMQLLRLVLIFQRRRD